MDIFLRWLQAGWLKERKDYEGYCVNYFHITAIDHHQHDKNWIFIDDTKKTKNRTFCFLIFAKNKTKKKSSCYIKYNGYSGSS